MVSTKNRSWISARPAMNGTANRKHDEPTPASAAMREARVRVVMR